MGDGTIAIRVQRKFVYNRLSVALSPHLPLGLEQRRAKVLSILEAFVVCLALCGGCRGCAVMSFLLSGVRQVVLGARHHSNYRSNSQLIFFKSRYSSR